MNKVIVGAGAFLTGMAAHKKLLDIGRRQYMKDKREGRAVGLSYPEYRQLRLTPSERKASDVLWKVLKPFI